MNATESERRRRDLDADRAVSEAREGDPPGRPGSLGRSLATPVGRAARWVGRGLGGLFYAALAFSTVASQAADPVLEWWSVDAGGATRAAGGAFGLAGTVGQTDAGAASGAPWALKAGFQGAPPPLLAPSPTPTAAPGDIGPKCPAADCLLIDFETQADGVTPITGDASADEAYAELGVRFSSARIGVVGSRAHSPSQVLRASIGGTTVGTHPGALELYFSRGQSFVGLFVGLDSPQPLAIAGELRAYRADRPDPVAVTRFTIPPGEDGVRTAVAVEQTQFDLETGQLGRMPVIGRVAVELEGDARELIDDLRFDRGFPRPAAPPPPCTGAIAPKVELIQPAVALVVSENRFLLETRILAEGPVDALRLQVRGSLPGQYRDEPFVLPGGGSPYRLGTWATGYLFEGRNEVELIAVDACGFGSSDKVPVTYLRPLGGAPSPCPPGGASADSTLFDEHPPDTTIVAQYRTTLGAVFPIHPRVQTATLVREGVDARVRAVPLGTVHPGPLVIQFAEPQRRVGMVIYAHPGRSAEGWLRAYDRPNGGALVRTVGPETYDHNGTFVVIEGSDRGDIYRVELEIGTDHNEGIGSLTTERRCDPLPAGPETVDLVAAAMEITQATNRVQGPAARPPGSVIPAQLQYDGVPLVAGKRTVVRVYAELEGASLPVEGVEAWLDLYRGAGAGADAFLRRLSPLGGAVGPADARVTVDPQENLFDRRRGNAPPTPLAGRKMYRAPDKSWNFLIPPELTEVGTLRIEARVNAGVGIPECPGTACDRNNSLSVYDLVFVETQPLVVHPVPVIINFDRPGETHPSDKAAICTFWNVGLRDRLNPDGSYATDGMGNPIKDGCRDDPTIAVSYAGLVSAIYPVREGSVQIAPSPGRIERHDNPASNDDFFEDMLANLRDFVAGRGPFVKGEVYYALVPQSGDGLAPYVNFFASGGIGRQEIATHEIGHSMGIKHASDAHKEQCADGWPEDDDYHCERDWPYPHGGIGELGFDSYRWLTVFTGSPPTGDHAHDQMSYGDFTAADTGLWTSPRNYCRMLNWFGGGSSDYCDRERGLAAVAQAAAEAAAPATRPGRVAADQATAPRDVLVVAGLLRRDGSGHLEPAYRALEAPSEHPAPPTVTFQVALLGPRGQDLAAQGIHLQALPEASRKDSVSFREQLPYDDAAVAVALRRGGIVIARLDRSPRAPSVTVLAPLGGEAWPAEGPQTVAWRGSDPDAGSSLRYQVQYSRDGAAWAALAPFGPEDRLTVDPATLPGGAQARFRVLASDGFNTVAAESGVLQVANKPPRIAILGIPAEASIAEGAPSRLTAMGFDLEDGSLDPAAWRWTVNGRPVPAAGPSLDLSILPAGEHLIALSAEDRAGQRASAEAGLRVVPARVSGALPGFPLTLTLAAEPIPAGNPQAVAIVWSSGGAVDPVSVTLALEGPGGLLALLEDARPGGQVQVPVPPGIAGRFEARIALRDGAGARVAAAQSLWLVPGVTPTPTDSPEPPGGRVFLPILRHEPRAGALGLRPAWLWATPPQPVAVLAPPPGSRRRPMAPVGRFSQRSQ